MERLESRTLLSFTVLLCTGETETTNLVVTGNEDSDTVEFRQNNGGVSISINEAAYKFYPAVSIVALDAGPGNDKVVIRGATLNTFVDGGEGNDSIYGSAGNDWLQDITGNDRIFGGEGNDYIVGGNSLLFQAELDCEPYKANIEREKQQCFHPITTEHYGTNTVGIAYTCCDICGAIL